MKIKTKEQIQQMTEKPLLKYEKALDEIASKLLTEVIDAGYGRYTTQDMRNIPNKSDLVVRHLEICDACYAVVLEKRRRKEYSGTYARIKWE